MPEDLYNLVFSGEICGEMGPETVKGNLARMLKCDDATVEKLFCGRPTVLKRSLSYRKAFQYSLALEQAGALCHLEVAVADAPATEPPCQAAPERPSALPCCPNCGAPLSDPVECPRCGIVFAKFHGAGEPEAVDARITVYDLVKERRQWIVLAVLLCVLATVIYQFWIKQPKRYPPGVLVAGEPEQIILRDPKPWRVGERVIVPMARFRLKARVLSTERYRFDSVSDLAPIDLALGWGIMSDQRVLDLLEIGQGNRRFAIAPLENAPSLPIGELLAHASNMHMIPSNKGIEKTLEALEPGALIELAGYLIGVQEHGQWTWVSSLSRTDQGDGACEIVWVERMRVL